MEAIVSGVNWLDDSVWDMSMIVLLLGTHLFMTAHTGFIQRKAFTGIRLSVRRDPEAPGDVSQFRVLTTALALTTSTDNIIGVGTAIFLGGPGVVFWCWLVGVFGIATKYVKSFIAVKYRVRTPDGRMQGGAMYVLERGLNLKRLGVLFTALAALASSGTGCGIQINVIAKVIEDNIPVGIPPTVIGTIGGPLTGVVTIGDIRSIASVCEKLVPFIVAFYALGCVIILAINWDFLAPAVSTTLRLTFTPGAAAGGLVGQGFMAAMRFGVARGLFPNELGMGSAPLVASAAQTHSPVWQALVSATGTFWDTVVVCLMTGLVLVATIMKNPATDMTQISDDGQLTTLAFAQVPVFGPVILVVDIITFAWSTILGWSYYGERCARYLWGKRALLPYRLVFVAVVVVGPVLALDLVWIVADILDILTATPNLAAVLLLSEVVAREIRHYLGNLDEADQTEILRVDKQEVEASSCLRTVGVYFLM